MKGPYVMIIFFILGLRPGCLWGQFYSTGEPPASLHWKQINTPHFSIIFPEAIGQDAHELAVKLEYYKLQTESDLQFPVKRFPVVLHSTSVLSNGYVTLAPGRMELVSVPPQDGYAQDWITQLTLHEYRHTVHLSKINQGFTHALSWMTGEIAPGVVSSMIPSWFYEGDAVYNETRLSESGRGRIPGFEMPLRTILLQQPGTYSYDKAVFGSYRDFVPDQYRYGYPMVRYARSRYGDQVWSQAIDYTAKHPFYFWPLAFYLKKNYGIYKSGLYRHTMDSLKVNYNRQEDTITYIKYLSNNVRTGKIFTSYTLPRGLKNGSILARRNGLDDPGSFVTVDSSGRETRLFTTGYSMGLNSDVWGDLLVWDEIVADPRWGRRDYSVLWLCDLSTGKRHALTSRSRFFSPDFSPEGKRIAVAETDAGGRNYVTVLDALTGQRMIAIPTPMNNAVQFPEWVSDSEIVVITVSGKGKQLESIGLNTGQWTVILPFTRLDISEPEHYGNYILFRSSYHGIENIFAVDKTPSSTLYQVTFSRFGAYNPAVSLDSTRLLFSSYTPAGFDVVSIPLDTSTWKRIPLPAYQPGESDANIPGIMDDANPQVPYPQRSYSKLSHTFDLHSWLPFYIDLEDYTTSIQEIPINLGVMLFSQNLLSTVISSIGYRYYQGYHQVIPTLSWRMWYPVFEVSGQFGNPVNTVSVKSYVPLAFTGGRYITRLQPQAEYEYTGTEIVSGEDRVKGLHYLHAKLFFSRYLRYSVRDLYPRWGQSLAVTYTQTPADHDLFGSLASVQAVTYFPGLIRHHHLFCIAGFQLQDPGTYLLPINRVAFPRGYSDEVSRKFTSLLWNYSFPVVYPDWALGPVIYLKRIRANLFYDWSYGTELVKAHEAGMERYTGTYQSFGAEILADMHVIRIIFPLSIGIRMGYIPGEKQFFNGLMFRMNTGIF